MEEIDIHAKLAQIETAPHFSMIFDGDTERAEMIADHLIWLHSIRRERPLVSRPFKVGIYIRYFNQTRYENYLDFHKKGFIDTLALCPKWDLVDFYIDEGQTAPNMESAPEWCRLLQDCMDGKVDLIITQKVSNVTKKPQEITILSRLLATLPHPVGIYFISEDIFTLASYPISTSEEKMVVSVLPLSCDNKPGTFSKSRNGGRFSAMIRAISKNTVPLVSWNPSLRPATEKL